MPALRTIRVRTRLSNPQEAPPGTTPVTYGDGLLLDGTVLEADFGTGHTEVARGDSVGGADLSTDTPQPLGSATAGASGEASDAAHVHAMPSAADVGAVPTSRTVTPLTGLTGGGALSGNISLAVDTTTIATVVYADTGDADTLAAAEAYTDAAIAGAGGGLPTAAAADEFPVSTAAGTTYAARTPAQVRTALDLDARYVAIPARAALYMVGAGMIGTTIGDAPHWNDGASFILMMWPTSITGDVRLLASRNNAVGQIRVGDDADTGRFAIYANGGVRTLPADHTLTGNLAGVHVLAITCTGGNFRTSWDGGTVGVTSAGGTPALPGVSVFSLGGDASGSFCPDIEYLAVRSYSTILSDADLIAAGSAAARLAGTIPTLTGTVSYDFNARNVVGELCQEIIHTAVTLQATGALKRRRAR